MSRRPKACVYCGNPHGCTMDHVPGEQFFPPPRPSNLITVPSCQYCGASFQKDEVYILTVMMFTEAGVKGAGKKVWESHALKAITRPESAAFRNYFDGRMTDVGLRTPAGLYLGKSKAMVLDMPRFQNFINKCVRGLFYHETKRALPPTADIHAFNVKTDRDMQRFFFPMKDGDRSWPGVFEYRYAITTDNPNASAWMFHFFGHFIIGAFQSSKRIRPRKQGKQSS